MGGMPGTGSTFAATSRPNAAAKYDHERWYVKIVFSGSFAATADWRAYAASTSFANASARAWYVAAFAGSAAPSASAMLRATIAPFRGSSQ